jgi:sec-independent protein translocase protein TatC
VTDSSRRPGGDPEEDLPRMSFLEHLEDLRKRLFWSAFAVAAGFMVCWWKAKPIFNWLAKPVLAALPPGTKLAYTQLTEPFMLYINIALLAGVFVASPVILYQLWLFIAPGLYKREKKVVIPFVATGTLLFYCGLAFTYFLVMPYAFPALAAIAGPDMKPLLTMREQLSLVLAMMLGFGVVFEIPVIVAFLAMIGVVTPEFLSKYRRHAMIVNVIVAALITPTGDPFNLAIMAIPMIIFYEVGIIAARIVGKKRKADEPATAS